MKVRIGRSFSAGQLRETTKTNRERWVDLSPELASILREHVRRAGKVFTATSDDFVFTNSAGEPLDGANLRERVWRRTLQRCGIAYRPIYNCRHTYASILLMKGMSVLYVSEQLGHQSAETTLKYYARFIPKMGGQVHVHLGTMQEKEAEERKTWHMTGTSGEGDGRK
jgi:integrase